MRPAHDLEPRERVRGQQLEPRLVARGRIVEADAVEEDEAVVGLGAANPDLGLGPARPGRRDRDAGGEPQQVRAPPAAPDRPSISSSNEVTEAAASSAATGWREAVTTIV